MSREAKAGLGLVLGMAGVLLMFGLGEGLNRLPGGEGGHVAVFVAGLGGYFFAVQYFLSRGNPQAPRTDWPIIIALTATLIGVAILALMIEPNKGAAFQAAGAAVLAVACAWAGAALAARSARNSTSGRE